jgi:chromosome segregation ATPase
MPTKQEFSYRNEMDHLRKDMASLAGELEDAETQNLRVKRELNEALLTIGSMTGENSRLNKSKKRLQFDFEEAVGNLAAERAAITELGNKLKKLSKQLNDEKLITRDAEADRDDATAQMRAIAGKVEGIEDKLRVSERAIAGVEEEKKQLQLQVVSINEKKLRTERVIEEMEGYQAGLERRLSDAKAQVGSLTNDNKNKEAELRGMDLALNTAKSMAAAEAAKADEKIDVLSGQLTKVQRVLQTTETELESSLSAAAAARRLADQQIAGLQNDYENLKATNDDLLNTIQKLKRGF